MFLGDDYTYQHSIYSHFYAQITDLLLYCTYVLALNQSNKVYLGVSKDKRDDLLWNSWTCLLIEINVSEGYLLKPGII